MIIYISLINVKKFGQILRLGLRKTHFWIIAPLRGPCPSLPRGPHQSFHQCQPRSHGGWYQTWKKFFIIKGNFFFIFWDVIFWVIWVQKQILNTFFSYIFWNVWYQPPWERGWHWWKDWWSPWNKEGQCWTLLK